MKPTTAEMSVPALEPGVTLLDVDSHRSTALHEIALTSTRKMGGETTLIDAGGTASTGAFTNGERRRSLRRIRVARAFTVHQHHQLVRKAVSQATARTGLVVAPNVSMLYESGDAPAAELDRLFRSSVALLSNLATSREIPILVSAPRADSDKWEQLVQGASKEIAVESTTLGYAYRAEGFEQMGYWNRGWWQSTIPYWVDLFGTVEEWDTTEAVTDPFEAVA